MSPCRLLTVVWLASAFACGKRAVPPGGGPDAENQALMRKADGYWQCHEDHTHTVFRLEDSYRERFATSAPDPGSEHVLPRLADPKPCLDAVAAAKTMMPAVPELEAAGAGYATALAEIYRLTTPDRMQAEGLHLELLATFDAFERAQVAMFDQLYQINRKVHIAQFDQRRRKEGRTLSITIEEAALRAEDLVRFAATPASQLDTLDLDALSRSLALYERTVDELEAFGVEHPRQVKQHLTYRDVVERANKVTVAARQLMHRARGNVPYSDAEKLMIAARNDANVVGAPGALAFAYNRLIELR